MSTPSHTNRLVHEKSPYLLQHAHNPVDWHPWGEEAFELARSHGKPIFLSIGYSTCHWCHVMERESFENEEIAALLNRHFVNIKLDREERPDVDRLYMQFVQATTGSGGWPMSVWLTPELKPFYGGTYFPPDSRYGRPGFPYLIEQIAGAWQTRRQQLVDSAASILSELERHSALNADPLLLNPEALDKSFFYFRRIYDARFGGFGDAPKFPRPSVFQFLFRYHRRSGNEEALDMTLHTLRAMAAGGMMDQLGGGFHRYSVDERWHVPHFEKMLYDQAQLATAYLEAFQITGDDQYAATAVSVLSYVLDEMTHPEGGFFSAEDADSAADPARPSEKSEGAFYIWSEDEIRAAVAEPAASWLVHHFGCQPSGNALNDPHGEFTGRNILFVASTAEETAAHFNADPAEVSAAIADARRTLLSLRAERPRPHLDDKILTGWNSMMISAFAQAARILDASRPEFAGRCLGAAQRAASFIGNHLTTPDGGLLRRWRDGESAIPAFLDDYALTVAALVDLYEATFETAHLTRASELARLAIQLFEDTENGAFFSSPASTGDLLLRMKDDYDGAEPAGNSSMASALLRLSAYTGEPAFAESAGRIFQAFSDRITNQGPALPALLSAWMYDLAPKSQLVVAAPALDGNAREMLRTAAARFRPELVVILRTPGQTAHPLEGAHPELSSMNAGGGSAAAYLCRDFVCQAPVTTAGDLAKLLD